MLQLQVPRQTQINVQQRKNKPTITPPINDGSNNTKQNLPLPEHRLQAKPTLIYTQPRPGRYIKGTLCST